MTQKTRLEGSTLRRGRLEKNLDEGRSRRLTLLVADAGFGKTTLLSSWARPLPAAWLSFSKEEQTLARASAALDDALGAVAVTSPESRLGLERPTTERDDERSRITAVASAFCSALAERLTSDLYLVLDDFHELGKASPAARLIEALVRQAPAGLHFVVSSRNELPFGTQRLRGQGQVLQVTAEDLAFDEDEVRLLLGATLDREAEELAPVLHDLTRGWPAAVRLAVEALRTAGPAGRVAAVERLQRADGPLFAYLAEEVFAGQSRRIRDFVATVASLERFSVELCGSLGLPRAGETIAVLEHSGLAMRTDARWYVLHGLVREFALECLGLDAARRVEVQSLAADWLESVGRFAEALEAALRSGDPDRVRRLLVQHGEALVRAGSTDLILEAVGTIPSTARDYEVEQLAGEAHLLRSEWSEALAWFERASGQTERPPAKLAYLMGRVEWERGRQDAALDVFRRGDLEGASPTDAALLLAWTARPLWNLGNVQEAREIAGRALEAAVISDDADALAAAHTAVAMTSLGDDRQRVEKHTQLALAAAEEAGDASTALRTRLNRSHLLEPREALPEIEAALAIAEVVGDATNLAFALHARGEANYYLGRLEPAAVDFDRARTLNDRLDSTKSCWNLMYLGDVARERGEVARARAAYEQSLGIARRGNDAQGLRGSQAGLALVLAPEDPGRARELATAAVEIGRTVVHDVAAALNAAGWVALLAGLHDEAAAYAREAESQASRQQFRPHLAEATELAAMCGPPAERERRLADAGVIWRSLGNELALARNDLAVARVRGDATAVRRLMRRLRAAGVRESAAAAAGMLASVPPETPEPLAIRTLGGFAVLREGLPVELAEWRSRKARDLLKILLSRRGRPIPRDALAETLWPDESPEVVSPRLSVALSMLRGVLDPGKRFDAAHFVRADHAAVQLQRANVVIDVEEFLTDARAGLAGDEERLLAAEDAYAGEFLEEDLYEDWSVGLREEGRAAYMEVARALARKAVADADVSAACRFLLRILERDRYDEQAHLELVTVLEDAGRHGEARRAYQRYAARMAELELEPATYPAAVRS